MPLFFLFVCSFISFVNSSLIYFCAARLGHTCAPVRGFISQSGTFRGCMSFSVAARMPLTQLPFSRGSTGPPVSSSAGVFVFHIPRICPTLPYAALNCPSFSFLFFFFLHPRSRVYQAPLLRTLSHIYSPAPKLFVPTELLPLLL